MTVKPLLGCSCSTPTKAVVPMNARTSARSSCRDTAHFCAVSPPIEWQQRGGESGTWHLKSQMTTWKSNANLGSLFLNFLENAFYCQRPKAQIPHCAFMLNTSLFSTIKILLIPALGSPMKCHAFSHKPLWHTGVSPLTDPGWSLTASPAAPGRGKDVTGCSVSTE